MSVSKVLRIATGQIGVCESPANSNRTKYGKAFGVNGKPWCDMFLWWCFTEAGEYYPHTGNAADSQDLLAKKGKWMLKKGSSKTSRKNYLKWAKPGDVVAFDFGAMDSYRRHIGIVESVSGDYLICIEGNTSKTGSQSNGGMVCRQRRFYTSVCAAVRPSYGADHAKTKKTAAKKSSPKSFKAGSTYTVQVDGLNVRSGPGTEYHRKERKELTADGMRHSDGSGRLKKGTRVTCHAEQKVGSEVWIRIPSGWICAYNGRKYYVK